MTTTRSSHVPSRRSGALLFALLLSPSFALPHEARHARADISSADDVASPRSVSVGRKGGVKVPVKRYDAHQAKFGKRDRTPEERRAWALRQARYVKNKWSNAFNQTVSSASKKKRSYVGLTDVSSDSYYYADVEIGTPSQTMGLVLDTGSADLWLPTSSCSSSTCSSLTKFDTSSSTTYQSSTETFEITYGTGAVSGTMAGDTVTLAGYSVYSQSFAVANQVASDTVSAPASGIFGFAFQELSTAGVTPWWEVLVKQNKLTDNAFTFQLVRASDASSSTTTDGVTTVDGGVFTIGEIDSAQYSGSISYSTIPSAYTKYGYWSIMLESYTLNGGSAQSVNSIACIDTGTTLIASSYAFASTFYGQISGSISMESEYGSSYKGLYAFPCTSSVSVSLTFGGVSYSMNSADFNYGAVDKTGEYCLGAVFGTEVGSGTPDFIIGDAFLKNWFSVFSWDQGGVGFASLVDGKAQTVATDSVGISSGSSSGSTSTMFSDSAAITARQYGGPGFGGPGYGGSTTTAAATSASWTSVSVKATAATGTGIYWASGIASPTASGESVRTGSVKLVNGASSRAQSVGVVAKSAVGLFVAMGLGASFVLL